jgi:predicted nucleic acid-binding protein
MQRSLVCVDANIIISLVTAEAQSQKALNLWTKWMQEDIHVASPSLLRYEVTSALRRKVVCGIMSYEDARRSLEAVSSLDIEFFDQPELSVKPVKSVTFC